MISERNLPAKIEIDGRVSAANIQEYGNGLVDYFVTGSTVLSRDNLEGTVAEAQMLRRTILGI